MTKPVASRLCRSVTTASELLKLIANANRLALVCYLMEQEAQVGELEAELRIPQPSLSQQLSILREAGAIACRREGKNMIYSVADPRIEQIVLRLREIFSGLEDVTGRNVANRVKSDLMPDLMFD
ncbi:metalloregulator ArsR/SmtB family transcription factor [Pseudochrobactrum sp. sp1633]|uniref:ArsR/SmtB family transcription factor n=1 Tax=Pseudochrobactrum sp. sp1633 TaxID=3036706 RepID=UPI0025A58C5A|nr:metalloregulator ArsR/SmtB family transcription factor [Pseudochrobactrum sp. sp1633]MDM8346850.1 metalloregulator ArsR/SmtB family transcription factor [Pseudochrobactrum sp. sp1633]HWD12571.1 metalloregulator ArsR/SmtB family transcription factor [Pseudochrobactrum sp.]